MKTKQDVINHFQSVIDACSKEDIEKIKEFFPLSNLKKIQRELIEQIKTAPDFNTRRVLHYMLDRVEGTMILLYTKEVI